MSRWCESLLKHGANVNTADKIGYNPLYVAGWYGHVEVVREFAETWR